MLDKRLNDKGKNWRHVFKVLIVHYLAFHYIHLRIYIELNGIGLLSSSRFRERRYLLS